MDKVVYIKAYFRPVGKEVIVKVATGETKKGLFGGEKQVMRKENQWEQTGFSDSEIDGERLASDLQVEVDALNKEGYSVQAITPINSGSYNYKYHTQEISSSPRLFGNTESVTGGKNYSYGYGYSYTESLIVHAVKNV